MLSRAEKNFLKLFSNRRVVNPLDREVNDLCLYIHKQVKRALTNESLVCELVNLDKTYYGDERNGEYTKTTFTTKELDALYENAKVDFVRRVKDAEALYTLAIKKYNQAKQGAGTDVLSGFSLNEEVKWKFETYNRLAAYDKRTIGYYIVGHCTCDIKIDGVEASIKDLSDIKW